MLRAAKVVSYLHLSSQYQRAVVYNMNLHPNQISQFVTRESNFRGSPLDSFKSRRADFIGADTHQRVLSPLVRKFSLGKVGG